MSDYREFLPEPPEECRDPGLFRMLNEFHFVRWHPDHVRRREELKREIFSEPVLQRAEAGVADPSELLSCYSGSLLIWARRDKAAPIAVALLTDPSEHVRGNIASSLQQVRDERFHGPLVELARSDPSPFVRRSAVSGLGGQDPLVAVPVLLEIMERDHEEDATGHTPASSAANALDELMQTEWTMKRHGGALRSLHPEGEEWESLKEQARVFLERMRGGTGGCGKEREEDGRWQMEEFI